MKRNIGLILVIIICFFSLSAGKVFSQGAAEQDMLNPQAEPEIQWVWGEVVTLDTVNKTVLLKYLDYESGEDREITIGIDDKTAYENMQSFDEIKPNDALSIDYITGPAGNNIAKNINLEKPQELTPPQDLTPQVTVQPEASSETLPVAAEEAPVENTQAQAETE